MSDLEQDKATLEDSSDSENGINLLDTENGDNSSVHSSNTPDFVDPNTSSEWDFSGFENATARATKEIRSKSVGDNPIPSSEPIAAEELPVFFTDPDGRVYTLITESELSTSTAASSQLQTTTGTTVTTSNPSQSKVTSKTTKMDEQLKAVFTDMTNSFKEIGLAAKQNSTNFLGDIPYYGVSKDEAKNKNIIPLNEPTRFLDIIDVMTDKAAFNESGKINVLKSKLLGPALEHWNTFAGGESWAAAREHLLKLYPEVQSYTSVMAKIPNLKREQKEQISSYATRIVKLFDTLKRLHPTNAISDQVVQSDSIRKLLEVLPETDRKWIKISNPVTNTFWEVLKQILTYVETETALKLTMDDIDKEQKGKSGTYEVNNTQNVPGNSQSQKQSIQQISGKDQPSNSGDNQSKKQNPNAGKQCNYCHNKGHIITECRKKKWAEENNKSSKNNYQNNKNYNNGNNFKYNPNHNKGYQNRGNKDNIRCSFCNIKGHTIGTCRHRQKEEYQNTGNGGANTSWCKYCKCAGHTIAVCKKRMYKESQGGNNQNYSNNSGGANSNNYSNNARRCFRCNETTHIAKYCNNNFNRNF